MARLYYEELALNDGQLPRMGFSTQAEKSSTMRYLEKVSKLVPSEIIAGYMTLVGFVPLVKVSRLQPWLYLGILTLCVVLTPSYLNLQAEKNKPKRNHLILSTIAFLIWAYVISGPTIIPQFYDQAAASIVLIAFSLASGVVPLNR